MKFKTATLAAFNRNVKNGKWVPLNPRLPDQWSVAVKIPAASRGVHNHAGRIVCIEIMGDEK